MKDYSFNTAYTQARELYGLTLNPDEFETIGLIAWDKIGNKKTRLYRYQGAPVETEAGDFYVELPCNADIIEAVTADYEDYKRVSPMSLPGNNEKGWVEGYVESRKFNTNSLYPSGKFIKYTKEGNRIYLADNFEVVNILYKGILLDDAGLPSLNERELDAVAAFCAYSDTFKEALVTRNTNSMQFAQVLEAKWKRMCTQARVPDYINQNEFDEILNVSNNWDRKRFGISYKPIR